jgi:hypothetical protein
MGRCRVNYYDGLVGAGFGCATYDADIASAFNPAFPTDLMEIYATGTRCCWTPEFPRGPKAYETFSHSLPGGAKILYWTGSQCGGF